MTTDRLQLLPATPEICEAEAQGRDALARVLDAQVPVSWPPPVLEPDDVERIRRQLADDPTSAAWTLHYIIRRADEPGGTPELVGVAGYGAAPDADGSVDIGYAVAQEHQRRGYAVEAVHALIAAAFADPRVHVVVATTYPSLEPSIGVLLKTGFVHVADQPDTGVMRFERRR